MKGAVPTATGRQTQGGAEVPCGPQRRLCPGPVKAKAPYIPAQPPSTALLIRVGGRGATALSGCLTSREGECLQLRRKETCDPQFLSPDLTGWRRKVTYRSRAEAPSSAQPESCGYKAALAPGPDVLSASWERPGKTQKGQSAKNAPTGKTTGFPALRVAARRLNTQSKGAVSLLGHHFGTSLSHTVWGNGGVPLG